MAGFTLLPIRVRNNVANNCLQENKKQCCEYCYSDYAHTFNMSISNWDVREIIASDQFVTQTQEENILYVNCHHP